MEPKWKTQRYGDGTEQVWLERRGKVAPLYLIERVLREKSRRKNWAVVCRDRSDGLYPPKVAGPFKDLDAAKAALVMLYASLT